MVRSSPIRGLLGQPLFLCTLFISIAAFFSAFVGQVILEKKYQAQNGQGSACGVAWFGVFLELAIIVSIFVTLASDSVERNRGQLSTFLAIAIVFGVFGTNLGIFTATSFQRAIGAGWILLTMINIVWLLYFSAEEGSVFLRIFDSTSRTLDPRGSNPAHRSNSIAQRSVGGNTSNHQTPATVNGSAASFIYGGKSPVGNMSNANLSHHGHAEEGGAGGSRIGGGSLSVNGPGMHSAATPSLGGAPSLLDGQSVDFAQKARALYSCTFSTLSRFGCIRLTRVAPSHSEIDTASPDDPNELSFTKGEILDITDTSGKWWQARKVDGQGSKLVGIVPSNYLGESLSFEHTLQPT
ncbi:BZ3500_MvSof-1268-A1-R1_Chr6-3g08677 [Microbotryum saponariae]|uniref:BZ3500_MvSof-1268-A1-R1_Chr6-3g08677 protein n=1 Tax=Microbotryum saponariae TaxID=289078 RepID=A0A2X0KIL7_9BASI|nr:BZ3500_MvSof-1268-A1-R1_Chr6-3g08677 [Microbotryum saponariae]SDA07278.1 BZ3501_MvSof-1269-A2-R1_Chr6-2g08380 [Microbotryum saponariae]